MEALKQAFGVNRLFLCDELKSPLGVTADHVFGAALEPCYDKSSNSSHSIS